MAFPIAPLYDWVILKPIPENAYSPSGLIYIPDPARKRPRSGVVMARGPGKVSEKTGEHVDMAFKVGDTVHHGPWSGTPIKYEGEDYLMIKEIEVWLLEVEPA